MLKYMKIGCINILKTSIQYIYAHNLQIDLKTLQLNLLFDKNIALFFDIYIHLFFSHQKRLISSLPKNLNPLHIYRL